MKRLAAVVVVSLLALACSDPASDDGQQAGGGGGQPSGGSGGITTGGGGITTGGGGAESAGGTAGGVAKPSDDFEARRARSDCVFSYALRDQTEIEKYTSGDQGPYSPRYDAAEDACRFTLGPDKPSSQQIWLPIFLAEKGQTVIVWEHKFSSNWIKENGLGVHKFVQVRRKAGDGAIWLEPQAAYVLPISSAGDNVFNPPKRVRHSRVRNYAALGPNAQSGPFDVDDPEFGSSHYDSDAMGPVLTNYFVPNQVWVRGLLVIEQIEGDPWAYISYAVADETHDPTLILDRVQLDLPDASGVAGEGRPLHFDFEINTSATRTGPEVWMWGRNVTVHRGVAKPLDLLKRP